MAISRTETVSLFILAALAMQLYLDHNNNMYRWSTWFAGDPIDHYRILNVTRGASRAEIKKAFHRLALILHPDTSQTKCDTTELFYLAQSAYDILYNKMKRMVYDLFNPDAGKWTVEYTWDIDFCSRLSYIFIDDFFRLAWKTVLTTYQYVTGILQQYGWFIVLACLVLLYIRSKIKPAYNQMKKRAVESRDKKIDPDVAQSRLEAMERARQRLQEEHDTKASRFMEQQVIKEEEKRKTKIEEWENLQQGKAYRSKVKPREDPSETPKGFKAKPKLRDTDYSPLMGGGGGAGYRPSRRAGGGGGG